MQQFIEDYWVEYLPNGDYYVCLNGTERWAIIWSYLDYVEENATEIILNVELYPKFLTDEQEFSKEFRELETLKITIPLVTPEIGRRHWWAYSSREKDQYYVLINVKDMSIEKGQILKVGKNMGNLAQCPVLDLYRYENPLFNETGDFQ